MSQLEAKYDELQAMGAEVAGIACEPHWSHAAYVARLKLRFRLLSDHAREVAPVWCDTYERVGSYRDVPKRCVFVLDAEGKVRWRWVGDKPSDVPDPEEIRVAVQEIVDE